MTIDEFRSRIEAYAERVKRVRDHVKNEEATKVALILPFVALLGYDDRDPTEVSAEHAADFSEKYKNRVDYAILRDGRPVVAIECKSVGNGKKDDRGQLKSYFNASKTVKLGILSDGIVFELFVDSQEPNIMDDEPFLVIDFEAIGRGQITETVVEGLRAITKGRFDPDTVSENARRNIIHKEFSAYLEQQFNEPTIDFTRFLLRENNIRFVRLNAIDSYRSIVKSAFDDLFTNNVLRRLDISAQNKSTQIRVEADLQADEKAKTIPLAEKTIETTQSELNAFEEVRRRLAFLCAGRIDLFSEIDRVKYRDYQGKMVVYYALERKGRLLDILENRGGDIRFQIAEADNAQPTKHLNDIDDRLIRLFEKRVSELGSS
jgi:hypothetical protein